MLTSFANGLELLLLLVGLLLSFVFCWGVRLLSPKLKLISKPADDRLSQNTVSMGGGLGWLGAFLFIVALGSWWLNNAELPELLREHRSGMISKVYDFTWILWGGRCVNAVGPL